MITAQRRDAWRSNVSGSARAVAIGFFALLIATGCTLNTTKKQYVLAEKLWADGKYPAAVAEFEKVYTRDSRGTLGRQALYRAATTQAYFLYQYGEAVKKLRTYADLSGADPSAWDSLLQIGEILFAKTESYEAAAEHYEELVQKRPNDSQVPLFLFRIAKSKFFLWKFEDAVHSYQNLMKRYPTSPYAERAAYEIGVTYFTRGEHRDGHGESRSDRVSTSEAYQEAIDAYNAFIAKYPKSALVPEARFGVASCLEELDQLDAAYHAYEALKSTYPSPKVIEIKLFRIKERRAQRSR